MLMHMTDATMVTCAMASAIFGHIKPPKLHLERLDSFGVVWNDAETAVTYHLLLVHLPALVGCYLIKCGYEE